MPVDGAISPFYLQHYYTKIRLFSLYGLAPRLFESGLQGLHDLEIVAPGRVSSRTKRGITMLSSNHMYMRSSVASTYRGQDSCSYSDGDAYLRNAR